MTQKRSKFFEINRSFVLALRAVGKGRSAAAKITSILNLPAPINARCWTKHTNAISEHAESLCRDNMKQEAYNTKLYLRSIGQIEQTSDTQLRDKVIDVGVSVDGSWSTRGWKAREGIVDVCFEETGKVLDVILKLTKCDTCKKMKEKSSNGEISQLEYLEWYVKHEPTCMVNHDGSAQVGVLFT